MSSVVGFMLSSWQPQAFIKLRVDVYRPGHGMKTQDVLYVTCSEENDPCVLSLFKMHHSGEDCTFLYQLEPGGAKKKKQLSLQGPVV